MSSSVRRYGRPARVTADGGFTLIELIIAITLGGVIAGVVVAALITSFSVASATTGQVKDSIDAGLIATYLYRDAQSAGAVDPASALLDPKLGVSTTDRGVGCATPVAGVSPKLIVDHAAANLVVRFSWIDRTTLNVASRVLVTYALTPINQPSTTERVLTRRICQPDAPVPVDSVVVLGRTVTSAVATCVPTPTDDAVDPVDPCAGRPASVTLAVRGTGAGAPFAYDLTASLRGQTQDAADADNSAAIAVIALGAPSATPSCPTVALNGTGSLTVGNGLIRSTCDPNAIRGYPNPFRQLAGTATSFPASIADPLGLTAAPSAACPATGGTNPSAGPGYRPGTYQLAVDIGTAVTFQPGNYVFCAGLHINSGASVTAPDADEVVGTGDGVMLYIVKGGLIVDANATVDLAASTTGVSPNLLIWVATTLPQPQVVTIAGGSLANSFRGLIYAPTSTVTLSSAVGANLGSLISGNVVVGAGSGPIRIGEVPSQSIDADIPHAEVGVRSVIGFSSRGGTAPSTWSATGLPSWLTFGRTTGLLDGTPPAAGTFVFDVTALDATNAATSVRVTMVVEPVLEISASMDVGEVGVEYASNGISATNGLQPYEWSVSGLPDGLEIDPDTGAVTGTPTEAGTFAVTITVSDAIGGVDSAQVALLIQPPAAVSVPAALEGGEVGVVYSSTAVVGSGGRPPYTWSATGLPDGVTMDASSGLVSGVPSESGTFDVAITMTDVLGGTDSAEVTLVIRVAPVVTAPTALEDGQVSAGYESSAVSGSGGSTPYTWSATGLPDGLTMDPVTALISGKPTRIGDSSVTVTLTDAVGAQDTATVTLTVDPPPSELGVLGPAALPAGQVGIAYAGTTIIGTGGFPPYTWSAGALPAGLVINAGTGVVSGTPTTAGSSTATVTVTDDEGESASRSWTVTIKPVPSISGPAALPVGDVGFAYKSTTVTGTGGTTAYAWSASGLPAGLAISSTTGVISGTATAAANVTATVTLRDAVGAIAQRDFPVTINAAQVVTGPAALLSGQIAQPYASPAYTSTGGTAPFVWSATGLPAGTTMSASGTISGTPTTAATYTVVAKVTDAVGSTATRSLPVTIKALPSVALPATMPAGQTNITYPSTTITAAGGTTPYTWSLTTALPAGLVLDATTGVVSGKPTVAGSVSTTVKVTDAVGATGSKTYTMVTKAVPTVSTTTLPGGQVNVAYTTTVKGTGGSTPYTWSATGLPPGLSIASATGIVSGTPTTAGSFTPTVTVTDAAAASSSTTFPAMVIKVPPTITGPAVLPPGDVGAVYKSTTMVGAGGSTKYTWTATGLPPGVVLASTTGVFSGTPTTVGSYSVTVTLKDALAATVTKSYTVTINAGQVITAPDALPSGQVGQVYAATYTSTGGSSPYTWTATGLPAGITIGSATGALGGTPTTAGSYTVIAKVTDAAGSAVTKSLALVVKAVPSISAPTTFPGGQVNISYSGTTVVGAGGTTPYVWSATAIPAGLTIDPASGVVSGTPTTAGSSTVTIKLTDAVNATVSKSWTSVVIKAAPSVTLAALPGGQVNIAYASTTLTGTGGTTAYVWSATGLPDGLAITSAGVVSGTPTVAGSFTPTVTLTDALGGVATKTFSVTIKSAPSITGPATLPSGDAGFAYPATTVTGAGGTTAYVWTATGLPSPMVINSSTGIITGTPTTAGSYSVTVTLKDALLATTTRVYPLTINAAQAIVTPATLPTGQVGIAYTPTTVTSTGGTGPYVWSATVLPAGLTIDPATGVVSGTPTTAGSSASTVKVTDALGASASKAYTVVVRAVPAISLPATLPAGQVNIVYTSTTATGTGGTTPYAWSATGLPDGVSIDAATGVVGGTPTAAGSFTPTVTLTDAVGATATKPYTVVIRAVPSISGPAALPSGDVAFAYQSTTVTGTGGSTAYAWSATGLPPGVVISSTTGVLSGTPTTVGSYSVVVTLKDSLNATATRTYPVTINAAQVITAPATLPAGQAGVAYTATGLTWTGGTAPYVWSMTGQPAGLTIDPASAVVSGTPTASGTFTITAKVTDSVGAIATKAYTVVFKVAVSVSSPATIPDGQVNIASTITLVGAGGTTPYAWSATGLPAGLSIAASTGVVSGTPTAAGAFSVTVTVTDAAGGTASRAYTPTIRPAPSVSGPAVLPGGTVGFAYPTTTMVGAGGLTPYTWTATGLPAGVTMSTAGVISGTPTTAGTSSTIVTVKDALNVTAPRTYSIVVSPVPAVSGPATLAAGEVGVAYTATVGATGGTTPYAWSATGLPAGLAIAPSTGVISGTPTGSGDVTVSVTVTDAVGATAARGWTLSIKVAPTVSGPASVPGGQIGVAYTSTTVTAVGGVTPYSWSVVGLPAGLAINASSGAITGTPTASGSFSATVVATDAVGASAQQVYALAVAPRAGTCPTTIGGWKGEYFANATLTGTSSLCRDDPNVDFDWGTGIPAPGLPADNFSVRWTATVNFTGGNYTVLLGADAGARLYLDGGLIIDRWSDQAYLPLTTLTGPISGVHTVVVEYRETTGTARVSLAWSSNPAGCAITAGGWLGQYYSTADLTGSPTVCRDDSEVGFDWGSGAPATGVPVDNFSARWTRTQNFLAGTYTFALGSDDGARLYIDGSLVLDRWFDQAYPSPVPTTARALTAGAHTIVVEYYDHADSARVMLTWT